MIKGLAAGVALFAAMTPAPARAETRALLAAVWQFQSSLIPDLAGPANDLTAMERLMRAEGATDITVLKNAGVTRATMETALHDLGLRSKPGDWIVFYYSGHGAQAEAAIKGTRDGDLDQFVPLAGFDPFAQDPQRFIVDKDFYDWFARYVPRDVNVLMIADTCHSGSLNRSVDRRSFHFTPRLALREQASEMKLVARPAPQYPVALAAGRSATAARPVDRADLPNLIYVGAAQDGQLALETPLPVEGAPARGLLTFALEQGLTLRGADGQTLLADLDADGQVTVGELAIYLDSQVRALAGQRQEPHTAFVTGRESLPLFVTSAVAAMPGMAGAVPERPLPQIFGPDGPAQAALRAPGSPWIPVDDIDDADFLWDQASGVLLRRTGDIVAQGVDGSAALRGIVEKWSTVETLRPLLNEARARLKVNPGGAGTAYRPGQTVNVDLAGRAAGDHATVFNLASDGTVQQLYPLEGDGDGRLGPAGLAGVIATQVVPPYGVDHVVAITSPLPQSELRALLRTIEGQRAAGRIIAPLRRVLAEAPGRSSLSIAEIYTGN